MLENSEGAIKNGQSRETGNIGYTRHRTNKTKTQHVWQTHSQEQRINSKANKSVFSTNFIQNVHSIMFS